MIDLRPSPVGFPRRATHLQPQRVEDLVLVGAHRLDVGQPRAVRREQHGAAQQPRLGLAQPQRAHGRAHAQDGAHQLGLHAEERNS